MKNFKLIVEYDGSAYHGWQRQQNSPTIQGEIENVIRIMTGIRVALIGSGRTDAGVHALGQVANFTCTTRLSPEALLHGLNSLLKKDIVILACSYAEDEFHARYDVRRKIYQYRILNRSVGSAIGRQYEYFIHRRLDIDAMRSAAATFTGTHDFKAFEGSGSPRKSSIRTVFRTELIELPDERLVFEIEADGFLKCMVRNIVGTLVYVGFGKIGPESIKELLLSKTRTLTGPTAPPHGLFLKEVRY
ncbi:MAG: tRNA pseudouridine(38-40) synthase TruA [Thermodesulfobacteriota bacterium]